MACPLCLQSLILHDTRDGFYTARDVSDRFAHAISILPSWRGNLGKINRTPSVSFATDAASIYDHPAQLNSTVPQLQRPSSATPLDACRSRTVTLSLRRPSHVILVVI